LPYIYDAQGRPTPTSSPRSARWAQGRIDAIALTSSGQVRRLVEVAAGARVRSAGCARGWPRTPIASVGPGGLGRTQVSRPAPPISHPPTTPYFMKPLISAMAAALGKNAATFPPSLRGEAKQSSSLGKAVDCFVALLLAMTKGRRSSRHSAACFRFRPGTPDRRSLIPSSSEVRARASPVWQGG